MSEARSPRDAKLEKQKKPNPSLLCVKISNANHPDLGLDGPIYVSELLGLKTREEEGDGTHTGWCMEKYAWISFPLR